MRTKTLLLTAAISAAGIAGSAAQEVFSANIVGYVTKDLVAGFNLIANPLAQDSANNTVSSVLGAVTPGTLVYTYNGTGFDTSEYVFDFGAGTEVWSNPDLEIAPGVGFYINAPDAGPITFVGEVRTGALSNDLPVGFKMVASEVPQAGAIQADLNYVPSPGDSVYLFDGAGFVEYSFVFDFGAGTEVWGPSEPVLEVGQAVWVNRAVAGSWDRTFTVDN